MVAFSSLCTTRPKDLEEDRLHFLNKPNKENLLSNLSEIRNLTLKTVSTEISNIDTKLVSI